MTLSKAATYRRTLATMRLAGQQNETVFLSGISFDRLRTANAGLPIQLQFFRFRDGRRTKHRGDTMTQEQIEAVWSRFMHRNDLTADYADIWLFASQMTVNRMMFSPVDIQEIIDTDPQVMVHGGLVYLAELAQDDVQLERETMKWATSCDAFQMNRSIQTPARMVRG